MKKAVEVLREIKKQAAPSKGTRCCCPQPSHDAASKASRWARRQHGAARPRVMDEMLAIRLGEDQLNRFVRASSSPAYQALLKVLACNQSSLITGRSGGSTCQCPFKKTKFLTSFVLIGEQLDKHGPAITCSSVLWSYPVGQAAERPHRSHSSF